MDLLIIQAVSLAITVFIGLMLLLCRMHLTTVVRRYELSRWMMVCAMGIYAIHFLIQIIFGLRASGDDVGAVVNILFYAPVTYLLSFAIMNLSGGRDHMKRHLIFSMVSYLTILATFFAGLSVHRSLHLGKMMYLMSAELSVSILIAAYFAYKESRHLISELESNTAGDLGIYSKFMFTGVVLLLFISLPVPAIIFSRPMLFVVGPMFLLLLFVYSVNFVCLGFSLRPVAEVLDARYNENGTVTNDASIQIALDSWLSKGGFTNPDISMMKLAQQLGCSQQELGRLISNNYGTTFRVWLSRIRLKEAKRMLIDKPYATIEVVAEDCGFTSRSYFQNLFKAETGLTPKEWRSKYVRL